MKGKGNDKRLHTTPEDWKYKSIKWMCGETFWAATLNNHKNSANKSNRKQATFMHLSLENSSGFEISKASYFPGQLPY